MKTTKRALFSSVMALILCFSMLVGTTFAWFTDEVKSDVNKIVAGNLDVDVLVDGESIQDKSVLFDEIKLWEPGVVAYENITVKNLGTLALKYQLSVNFSNENYVVEADGTVTDNCLADVLKVSVIEETIAANLSREAVLAMAGEGVLLSELVKSGELESMKNQAYAIIIWWPQSENDDTFNINNGKTTTDGEALHINLGLKVLATQLTFEADSFDKYYDGAANWYGDVDISWYVNDPDATEYTIGSPEELAGLAAIVNGTAVSSVATYSTAATAIQDSFEGVTIKLASDLNLNNINWTPIGNWDNAFEGTFDGQGHTIYNVNINDAAGEGTGLFGVVANATIKGLTLENVNVEAYSMVAALVGAAYPASISDCHVTGDINVVAEWAYVGGIAGYCYYGTQVDACSVIAEGTGVIKSETRNAVGGITAWLLEGDHKVTNCQVKNLNLTGWTNVGGITGFVHYSNTIGGCSVENVTLNKTRQDGNPGIGVIAGGYSYNANKAITLSNNTVKTAILNGTHIAYASYNNLYGSEYGGNTNANFVLENNTVENITNKLIEVQAIKTADGLKEAFANGGKYALSADLSLTETVTVPAGVDVVLYLNGKTISGSFENVSNANKVLFDVKGNLTINGEGTVTMSTTGIDMGWNAMGCTICVNGGDLTVNNATILNEGGTSMSYALDTNPWNSASNEVLDVVLNNVTVESTYFGIRVRDNGPYLVKLVANDSAIDEIWYQEYSSGDNVNKGNYGLLVEVHLNNTTASVKWVQEPGVLFINEVEAVTTAADLQAALDSATGTKTIVLGADITGDVIVTEKDGVNITINGNDYTYAGTITVDGNSARNTGSLTIRNVNFNAESLSADAYINLGGSNDTRYTDNVTVKDCTFSGDGFAAIKSYTGGDKNLTVSGCTVNAGMHSMLQVTNVEEGLTITGCYVYSKNGINLNNTPSLTMSGCTFDTTGYCVRIGVSGNTNSGSFTISDSSLTSANDDGDAVIIFRGAMSGATLTLTNTTLNGNPQITGDAKVVTK